VTSSTTVARSGFRYNNTTQRYLQTAIVRNNSTGALSVPISLVLEGLGSGISLFNKVGTTLCGGVQGSPYLNLNLGTANVLNPGQSITVALEFINPGNLAINYSTRVLAGSGER
jgi:hypothetical protein